MNRNPTGESPGEEREGQQPKLRWEHTVTRAEGTDTTGEVYRATLWGSLTGEISLQMGRHPHWPETWHLLAECGGDTQRRIAAEEPDPRPLMVRLETFAERWALAGSRPNVL